MRALSMLFNSLSFLVFFAVVLSLYHATRRSLRLQNGVLLASSYAFYGSWDWRFLGLLAFSTGVAFFFGKRIASADGVGARRVWLAWAVGLNLAVLATFKYLDFFASSLSQLFDAIGFHIDPLTLGIVLPIGISFYTFQAIGYVVDVYYGRLEPSRDLMEFALFIAFFPHLVAGPIQRTTVLLEQIRRPRTISPAQIHSAAFLILWGYFKKVVIADQCGVAADRIFGNYNEYGGLDLVVGVVAFAIQIYGDFSGYTDIARGISKLMGFELMLNFRLPYLASSPREFWRRWHISLSTWLRDYLYIPLGGDRGGRIRTCRNLFLTMLLGGLWHGAAWNFVAWGAYHGLLLVGLRFFRGATPGRGSERPASAWGGTFAVLGTLAATLLGWMIFRADSPQQFAYFLLHIFDLGTPVSDTYRLLLPAAVLLLVELAQHRSGDLNIMTRLHPVALGSFYLFLVIAICIGRAAQSPAFIYYRF